VHSSKFLVARSSFRAGRAFFTGGAGGRADGGGCSGAREVGREGNYGLGRYTGAVKSDGPFCETRANANDFLKYTPEAIK
jgi:hypothetical protein